MKKKLLISFFAFLFFLLPINIYAQEIINKDVSIYSLDNSIVDFNTSYDFEPEVKFSYNPNEQQHLSNTPIISCMAAYIADPATGKVFYEKNAHEKMYPASTTKILTALVVLENCQLSDTAVVSQNAIDLIPSSDYSDAGLIVGEEISIRDLLSALLIPSANEAANVLAEHVSGSIEAFAELCNNRAKELGCETLHFVNPNGIHSDDHYCSAYDLYLIAKECIKNDEFNNIVKQTRFTVPATEIYPYYDRVYENTNLLIQPFSLDYYYPRCTGIKTGHTSEAGECLVASCSLDYFKIISVVLGGSEKNVFGLNDRFYDTRQLFDFVDNNYSYKEISHKGDVLTTITVDKATKETSSLDLIINTNISTIVPNNLDTNTIPTYIDLPDKIVAPIKQFQKIAKVTYNVDGLTYTTDIIASHAVEKIPYVLINTIVFCSIILTISLISLIIWLIIKHHRKKQDGIVIENINFMN